VVSPSLTRAYAACSALAASHYENFPVASWLLPARMRPHVAAIYAYARRADDIADEGTEAADARRARLDAWQRRLHQAVAGPDTEPAASRQDLIVLATAHTVRELDLPLSLFDDLLSAFAQDTTTTRYDSWADLMDYCRRSANPVGRLVLRVAGYRDEAMDLSSDALCTGLQLANFWQDFGRDWRAGRVYVPREIYEPARASLDDLLAGHETAWMDALSECVSRTRRCFDHGREVCDSVRGRLKLELRLTWLGGSKILDRVERRTALLNERPTIGTRDLPALMWSVVRWQRKAA
jgi:squalene synthase HpnC